MIEVIIAVAIVAAGVGGYLFAQSRKEETPIPAPKPAPKKRNYYRKNTKKKSSGSAGGSGNYYNKNQK